MNVQHYFFLFLRYSWLVILLTAAALAGTYAWLNKQTPVYASRAVLQVEMENAKVVNIEDVKENRVTGLDAVNTVIQTLTSNTVMLGVARKTGLADEWAARDPTGQVTPSNESALAQSIRSQLTVGLRKGTRLIDIIAQSPDPDKARILAGEVVTQFLSLQTRDRDAVSKNASEFLLAEANRLRAKLEDSEKKIAQYRLDKKAISLNERQNIDEQRLSALNSQVTAANTERAALESDLAALKIIKPNDYQGMLKLHSVASLPEIALLRTTVTTKESEFAAIKERYLHLHPKYGAAESQLNEIKTKLNTAIASAGDTLQQQYTSFTETEQKLKNMLADQEAKTLALDQIAIPYKALERESESDRKLYETILSRLKETDVTQGLTKTPYRLTEEPLINPIPISPNKRKTLTTAALLAIAAGIGLILLIDRLDSSLRTVDEAERILELPVLAAVPEADLSKLPTGSISIMDDPGSAQAESFRTLRASLSLLGEEDQRRLLLVTSAIPSEGKTFTSLNLAAAFATQGLRTLLIDADLRRPALTALMIDRGHRQETDYHGLTDILSNLCPPEAAIHPTAIPNLSILPSGRRPPTPPNSSPNSPSPNSSSPSSKPTTASSSTAPPSTPSATPSPSPPTPMPPASSCAPAKPPAAPSSAPSTSSKKPAPASPASS